MEDQVNRIVLIKYLNSENGRLISPGRSREQRSNRVSRRPFHRGLCPAEGRGAKVITTIIDSISKQLGLAN